MSDPADLRDRLRTLAQALPPGGSVTFTQDGLLELIGDRPETEAAPLDDLTVEELAEEMGRAASTVRGWASRIPGAYRLGREWRFPRGAVRAWLDAGAELEGLERRPGAPVDLGSWRKHAGGDAA